MIKQTRPLVSAKRERPECPPPTPASEGRQFIEPSSHFVRRHGEVYCTFCRRDGQKTYADFIPAGVRRSIIFKKQFATCGAHLTAARQAVEEYLSLHCDEE